MTLILIPARFSSSRFPGKPLALIGGKTMIQRVYGQCVESKADRVVVATDDQRIFDAVKAFGGEVVMTSPHHASGTDRCGEAAETLSLRAEDLVVNVQGDEPFIKPELIDLLIERFEDEQVGIATLASQLSSQEAADPHIVKVVFSTAKKALYFSRFPIPFQRGGDQNPASLYKHIGIYAYRCHILRQLILLKESPLEAAERLEQLRWLENGFPIHLSLCDDTSISVDTPEDLARANHYAQEMEREQCQCVSPPKHEK